MSSGIHPTGVEEKLDVRKYLLVLRRRMWWGIVPFIVLALVFTTVCLAVPYKYLSTCTIKASKDEVAVILRSGASSKPTASSTIIYERMLRYDSVMEALANTDLMNEVERLSQDRPEDRPKLLDRLHSRIVSNTTLQELGRSKVLMRINHLGDSPDHAFTVLQKLINHFVENALKKERIDARRARDLAQAELTTAKDALEKLDSKLATFDQDHPGVDKAGGDGKRAELERAKQTLEQADTQISSSRRKLDRYAEQIRNMPKQKISEVTRKDNPEILVYLRRLADLRMALAANLKAYTKYHPNIRNLQQQVEATEQELARARAEQSEDQITLTINKVREDLQVKKYEIEAMLDSLIEIRRVVQLRKTELTEEVHARPGLQKQATALRRSLAAASAEYNEAVRSFRRVEEEFNNTVEGLVSFSIIRPPRKPHTRDIKHIMKLAMIGFVVSLAAAFGAIAGTEFLDQSFTDVEAARSFLQLPSLGVIPYIETPRDRRSRWLRFGIVTGSIVVSLALIAAVLYVTETYKTVWQWIEGLCKNLA